MVLYHSFLLFFIFSFLLVIDYDVGSATRSRAGAQLHPVGMDLMPREKLTNYEAVLEFKPNLKRGLHLVTKDHTSLREDVNTTTDDFADRLNAFRNRIAP